MSMINEFVDKHLLAYQSKYPKSDDFEQELDNFVSYFKSVNGYNQYSIEELKKAYEKCVENHYNYHTYSPIYETIDTHELLDLINNIHYRIKLLVFTPDHKYSPKHTYGCKIEEADEDTFCVEVYSNKGLVKSYDIPATGITTEKMLQIIDRERNEYKRSYG